MKTLMFLFGFLVTVSAFSAPFLVSDGHPTAERFEISWDNGGTWVDAQAKPDAQGEIQIYHDLQALDAGQYTVQARAWKGVEVSQPSVPFVFVLTRPAAPTNIRLEP